MKEDRDGTLNLAEICSTKKGNLTTKSLYKTRKGIDQRVMEIKNSLLPTSETSSGIPLSDGKVINFINFTQEIAKKSLRHDNIDNIVRQARDSGTYLKAFNGEVSNLTPEQWADVRTDNFKDFFGDWENDPENASQMVDENGEPKVFYHNTDNSFTAFDEKRNGSHTDAGWLGDGFYFYGDKNEGSGYGKNKMAVYLDEIPTMPRRRTWKDCQRPTAEKNR